MVAQVHPEPAGGHAQEFRSQVSRPPPYVHYRQAPCPKGSVSVSDRRGSEGEISEPELGVGRATPSRLGLELLVEWVFEPDQVCVCDTRECGPHSRASAGSGFGPRGPESAGSNFAPYYLHFVSRCVEFGRGAGRVRRIGAGSTGSEIRGHLPYPPLPLLS